VTAPPADFDALELFAGRPQDLADVRLLESLDDEA
jgi:hypothetical protein